MKKTLLDETLFNKDDYAALRDEYILGANRFDYLTGLPEMTYYFMLEDIGRKKNLEEGHHSAIVFFNLHGMKDFNRKYGFSDGDNLILSFARILEKHFGKEHCGRFGGDRFSAFARAEGIKETLNAVFNDFKQENGSKSLPVFAGIYLDEIEDVNASAACDRAKLASEELRHNPESAFYYFDLDMLEREKRRQYIIDNLDKAIEERWIQTYYQPIFRVVNDQVCAEECLARWIDPSQGIIYPGEFIPLLEDTGLVYKLDLCVIDQALERMNRFLSQGHSVVPYSVNISRSDFDSCDIVEEIRRRVDEAGIERNRLHIEITESVIGTDFDFIKSQVERFRGLGFQVWMDDFGSGYSSLDVLQNIRFDLIKLDMRFIQQYEQSEESGIIIAEITKMITALRMDVLCEGVETEAQLEFLREIGCSKVQGYYFCKPVSEDEILRRYEAGLRFEMENPAEQEYYSLISTFNIYNPTAVYKTQLGALEHYMDTVPVIIMEIGDDYVKPLRFTPSGRRFLMHFDDFPQLNSKLLIANHPEFVDSINKLASFEEWARVSDALEDGTIVESFVRWIAQNPLTGIKVVAIIILAISTEDED
ncbi:MAG: EAL domain-containing protein [Parasporobacterium sp.]|nr:EAL domain-containing protein [Parasporobacterium sp.]